MAVFYLDPDDEITGAISRIRAITERDGVMVIPPGSRIGTSRINFKLLAREAAGRNINIVAVSDEPQVRALAISAGLPAYDSVHTAQDALATFREQDRQLAQRIGGIMPREHPVSGIRGTDTVVMAQPTGAAPERPGFHAAAAGVPSETAVLPAVQAPAGRRRPAGRRLPIAPLLVAVLIVILLGAVVYGAYVFLPTATVTVRPAVVPVNVPAFTVSADPSVALTDVAAGLIPAQRLSVALHVQSTFPATGIDAHDTKAGGSVRLRSENTLNDVPVAANTVLSTVDGIDFVTLTDVTVLKASFSTGPTQVDVDVRAAKGGVKGNVSADAITVLPGALSTQLITVSNPKPTSGGKHIEDQVVSQDDYDAALSALNSQLPDALSVALVNPQSVPRGLTSYSATAQLGEAHADQPATSVVGLPGPTFTLALDTTALVTAVNETLVDDVARARVSAALTPGQKLVGDAIVVVHDGGTAVGQTVSYRVSASGSGYLDPDPQQIVAAVSGKSVSDAQAALASIGAVQVSIWPDFIDHLPDQAARISVRVIAPLASPALLPSPSPLASPAPSASPASVASALP